MMGIARPAGMHARLAVAVWLATSLAACALAPPAGEAPPASEAPPPSDGLMDGAWVLTSGAVDGEPFPLVADHRITLTIQGTQVGGIAACNHYGGRIEPAPDGFRIGELGGTQMGCAEPVMAAEAAYYAVLARIRAFERDGEELIARGDGVELRFGALAPPPTAELVDTPWVLESLLDGDVAAAPMGEPATLVLHAGGTFEGSTGCRTFTGTWQESGDQIITPNFGMDQTECPAALAEQDGHVVGVIGDGFIPTVDGDLLTLMDPGGIGLEYRSGE